MTAPHPGRRSVTAAAVTSTLRLGTYVLQAGVREPAHNAADAATLDLLVGGCCCDSAPATPRRSGTTSAESVEVIARLLHGDTVDVAGRYVSATGARLAGLPVGSGRIILAVGGGHPDVLAVAAARADIVCLSGLAALALLHR